MKFEYIKKKLIDLRSKVEVNNEVGHFDINKEVEDIYLHLLNDVYGWNLKNANVLKENFPAIDLIDNSNKILIQVTSQTDTIKLRGTIDKFKKLEEYSLGYALKMFYIKDILLMVQSDVNICKKVYDTLKKLFVDDVIKSQIIINVHDQEIFILKERLIKKLRKN